MKYRHVLAPLGIALFSAVIALVVLFGLIPITELFIAIVSALIVAIIAIGWWGFRDMIEEQKKPQEAKVINFPTVFVATPVLTLTPLPHYKGHPIPPKDLINVGRESAKDGLKIVKAFSNSYSSPEAENLQSSQFIALYNIWSIKNSPPVIADYCIVKFLVIRCSCETGEILGCNVQAKFRTITESGQKDESIWQDGGYLNWYSEELRQRIKAVKNEVFQYKGFGINRFLKNTLRISTKVKGKTFWFAI